MDGRGNLSRKALVAFSEWFLDVAIDQVDFCSKVFDLGTLSHRYRKHMERIFSDPRPGRLVTHVLAMGEVERGMAASVLGASERTARDVLSQCVDRGFLKSDTPKGKVRVGFPVEHRAWLFPDLFSDDVDPGRPGSARPDRRGPVASRQGRTRGGWDR